jgi:hypothetical protein
MDEPGLLIRQSRIWKFCADFFLFLFFRLCTHTHTHTHRGEREMTDDDLVSGLYFFFFLFLPTHATSSFPFLLGSTWNFLVAHQIKPKTQIRLVLLFFVWFRLRAAGHYYPRFETLMVVITLTRLLYRYTFCRPSHDDWLPPAGNISWQKERERERRGLIGGNECISFSLDKWRHFILFWFSLVGWYTPAQSLYGIWLSI